MVKKIHLAFFLFLFILTSFSNSAIAKKRDLEHLKFSRQFERTFFANTFFINIKQYISTEKGKEETTSLSIAAAIQMALVLMHLSDVLVGKDMLLQEQALKRMIFHSTISMATVGPLSSLMLWKALESTIPEKTSLYKDISKNLLGKKIILTKELVPVFEKSFQALLRAKKTWPYSKKKAYLRFYSPIKS